MYYGNMLPLAIEHLSLVTIQLRSVIEEKSKMLVIPDLITRLKVVNKSLLYTDLFNVKNLHNVIFLHNKCSLFKETTFTFY